jgi:protein-disulfide isomerase
MSRKTKIQAEARKAEAIRTRKRNRIIAAVAAVAVLGGIGFAYSSIVGTAPGPLRAATWDTKAVAPTDIALGDPKAPARITEYGSLTCVHCADFHERAFSEFKKDYIDTGKVYFVYSHFPYDAPSLQAASAVACLPKDKQPDALATLYESQKSWVFESDVTGAVMTKLGMGAGGSGDVLKCVTDGAKRDQVTKTAYEAGSRGIASTPTFVINGGVYEGFMSADVLGKIALGAKD